MIKALFKNSQKDQTRNKHFTNKHSNVFMTTFLKFFNIHFLKNLQIRISKLILNFIANFFISTKLDKHEKVERHFYRLFDHNSLYN